MLVRRRLPMMVTPKIDLRRIQVSVICSLLGYLNQNFRDSMFDFLVLIISKSRVLFDEYSAACIQASQLASSTLQSVDVGICDLNKLIADTTQFELVSFDRSAYRQGSIAVSSIVFELVANNTVHQSITLPASQAVVRTKSTKSTTTNNNNNDDDDDNNNDNEDDDEADAAVDEQRLPRLRLVVDLQQLRNWFQTIQCPANTMVYFSIKHIRSLLPNRISIVYSAAYVCESRRRPMLSPISSTLLRSTSRRCCSPASNVIEPLLPPATVDAIKAAQRCAKNSTVVAKFTGIVSTKSASAVGVAYAVLGPINNSKCARDVRRSYGFRLEIVVLCFRSVSFSLSILMSIDTQYVWRTQRRRRHR